MRGVPWRAAFGAARRFQRGDLCRSDAGRGTDADDCSGRSGAESDCAFYRRAAREGVPDASGCAAFETRADRFDPAMDCGGCEGPLTTIAGARPGGRARTRASAPPLVFGDEFHLYRVGYRLAWFYYYHSGFLAGPHFAVGIYPVELGLYYYKFLVQGRVDLDCGDLFR